MDQEVAADYRSWIEVQLEAHGGSVRAVWEAHNDAGYRLTEIRPLLHYFVQLEVWEEQEFIERELFARDDSWGLPSVDELRRGSTGMSFVERTEKRTLGTPRYRLRAAIDMQHFAALANSVHDQRRDADGDRRVIETNHTTGEQRVVTVRERTPGYDQLRWPGHRLARRLATRRPPFFTYKVLPLAAAKTAAGEGGSGSHSAPRAHLRRGHIRRLDNRVTWVRPAIVNANSERGVVEKDYRIGGREPGASEQ